VKPNVCYVSGILSPIIAFLLISIAILIHPWFSFNKNALSDLGALHTQNNWVFNSALILGGILAMIFSWSIQGRGENAVENAGYVVFFVASFFMMLIGLFPEGTTIHWTVSVMFFLLSAIAIFTVGLGFILSKRYVEGIFVIGLVMFALSLSFGIRWGGIAIPETIGAVSIAIWLYFEIFKLNICY
jgi:hypothetical membrane protein